MVEDEQMLIDVNPLPFHRVAGDPRDGLLVGPIALVCAKPVSRLRENRSLRRTRGRGGARQRIMQCSPDERVLAR